MVQLILVIVWVVLTVPVLVLAVQVGAFILARKTKASADPRVARPAVAVLMPAHDESAVIAATVTGLKPHLRPGDRLLVVADNCSDDTAAVARMAGAEVVERVDPDNRGKGFALDYGMRALAASPPEVVIVIDADCTVQSGSIDALAAQCSRHGRPAQARYFMHLPPAPSLRQRAGALAWLLKNEVRAGGYAKLGLPVQLMGTGMALPWHLAAGAKLASGQIVEDVQLGIDLAIGGNPAELCPAALVHSQFPTERDATDVQRTRWEHGQLGVMRSLLPRLLGQAARRRSVGLLMQALDVAVPPIALLALMLAGLGLVSGIAAAGGWGVIAFVLTISTTALLIAIVVLAWWVVGRGVISAGQLAGLPGYALSKVPMYWRWFTRRGEVAWIRTARDTRDKSVPGRREL